MKTELMTQKQIEALSIEQLEDKLKEIEDESLFKRADRIVAKEKAGTVAAPVVSSDSEQKK